MERTPTRQRPQATATTGNGNSWADIYQACVIKDDDNDSEDSLTGPKRDLLNSTDEFTVSIRTAIGLHASAESREGEDSYTSCSVDTSMSMSNDLLPPPPRLSPLGGNRPTGPTELESYCQRERENMMKRLVSSELRNSTTDFRMQLLEEERRVRERLLGGVEGGQEGNEGREMR
ncbi:MAG: hypothetical protein L6R39_007852 [Caloplaca ligustica]|nr:MAG: hypothetical protein L6R39_007852 [Caloplaca ligustica]